MTNRVVIIDSGIDQIFMENTNIKIASYYDFSECTSCEFISDKIGHGTAVASIIYSINHECEFMILKIYNETLEQDENVLIEALKYILQNNIENSIIHMSVGVNYFSSDIEKLCNSIYNKGNILVSAFDNLGCISYPAAFDAVIGVEGSDYCIKRSDFIIYENEIVDIFAKGGFHRVIGINGASAIKQGNSMSAAYVTGYLSTMYLFSYTKDEAIDKLKKISTYKSQNVYNENNYFDKKLVLTNRELKSITRAGVFPYNKETSVIIRNADLLDFKIEKIYTTKYNGNAGKIISCNENKYILENIEKIKNETIDTLIVGHLNKYELVIPGIKRMVLKKCCENQINVFSLDSDLVSKNIEQFNKRNLFIRCPIIFDENIGKKGKLYRIKTPILGIFGTSSNQGKFSLQLELKIFFEKNDYEIGFLATEPAAALFKADSTVSYGYNGIRNMNDYDFINLINNQLHNIDILDKDLIISGAQSRTIIQDANHLGHMAIKQIEFLLALQPDAVILCVNYNDPISYIKKTINVIESISNAKVVCLVLFPLGYKTGWKKQNEILEYIPDEILKNVKQNLENEISIKTYILGRDIEKIYSTIIDYF